MERKEARKIQRQVLDSIAKELFSKSQKEIEAIINSEEDEYSKLFNDANFFSGQAQETEYFYHDEVDVSVEYFNKEIKVDGNDLLQPVLSLKPSEFFKIESISNNNKVIHNNSVNDDNHKYSALTEKRPVALKGSSKYISDEDCDQCPIAA